jgi:hypothetical protein
MGSKKLQLGSQKFLINILLIISSLSMIYSPSFAQESNASSPTTTTTPKVNEKKKSKETNQAVAQGLSIAESMLLNQSPWGIFLNATATRGLDEFADTWSSVNELSLSYRIDSKSALGLSLGYETVLYEKDGAPFNNVDRDPGRFGVTDLEVSYTRPQIWSDKYNRLVWTSTLSLPASRASQRNSLIADVSTSLALRYRHNAKILITPSIGAYARQFRFDTSNAMGTQANSPVGITSGLSAAYTFNSIFIGTIFYGQTQRYDYFDDWRTIQTAVAQLNANVTATLNLSAGYRWRDRVITNEPLFDDDRSIYYIGVGYVF